jgi:hypothetical protein
MFACWEMRSILLVWVLCPVDRDQRGGDDPKGQPKAAVHVQLLQLVATEEEQAAQQVRDDAVVQRFAEEVQQ